jgi:hypothetical protein
MLDKYVTLKPLSLVIWMVINKKPPKTQYNPIKPTKGWAFFKKKKTRVFSNPGVKQIAKIKQK